MTALDPADVITVIRDSGYFYVACQVGPEGFKIVFNDPGVDIEVGDLALTRYGFRRVCDVIRFKDHTFVETGSHV